ncbi:MAG: inorganic phosphate transporter [Deltaproteobacteria bacterium GWA2_38_16]|nr:MAG: inorganic phosphate transporter [Deltaproteobacteria bacterium GWA2_38_16]OGQ02465.1 MAG: inorganic phosphate transporter [Deltaproteobacteria bacterium RIFCSPHIGHO2_02_FULL_38_15]OGQ33854.1 MAG: inorganic phosphate transporter [Deltaproteobacteria bacterium RIFCSPLOWO2_01_FULL_38_9]OGQ62180.1 MAG: inorganic phosphate transporter [Deltaproteobacteria bacterium RIFCSPLOWO2_12_FULL_38_8]HBQ21081.1 anion permease [Deltaproteobacteria bacterium]
MHELWFIIIIIAVALIFDFINGFHDAANSIATIVSTRVLRPHQAVIWAAFFNFVAFLFFGLHVANTIGKGVVDPTIIDPVVVVAALVGAIAWDLITWYYGIPSSSSHALIGGLAGAAVAKSGISALNSAGFIKISVSIVLSPLIGFMLAFIFMFLVSLIFFRTIPRKIDQWFRLLQFFSASLYSLGHGGNDAQKTMGIIAVLLFSAGFLGPTFHIPLWIVLSCHAAMGLGTLFGGWRIVKTMGMKITKLKPIGGFCAETAGACTLFFATGLGIPVSTTHTITGSIMGVGAVTKFSAVRWGVAERIIWAWIFTIPASAFIAAVTWSLTHIWF